jgi:hypothetical protein
MNHTYTPPTETKKVLWDKRYIIENLPVWIYTDNEQPNTILECKAKVSSLRYTIDDINLQIEIRELELKTGNSRHQSNFDFEKWKTQALRARQTHLYLLNAYSYWLILNEREYADKKVNSKVDALIQILIEDPVDIVPKLEALL